MMRRSKYINLICVLSIAAWQNNGAAAVSYNNVVGCTGSGCTTNSYSFVLNIDAAIGSSTDLGWIEGAITTSATHVANIVWSARAIVNSKLIEYEGVQCTGVTSAPTAPVYMAATSDSTNANFAAILPPLLLTPKPGGPPSAFLPPFTTWPLSPASQVVCPFAISVGNGILYNYKVASPLTVYAGTISAPTSAPDAAAGAELSVITTPASVTVTPQSYLSYWTWYLKPSAGIINHLGQIFGRSVDACTDDCVVVRLDSMSGGAIVQLTARFRISSASIATNTAVSYVIGLSNGADGSSPVIGVACNIGAIGNVLASATTTAIGVRFATATALAATFSNITVASITLWNPIYKFAECVFQYPVVNNATADINWGNSLYIYYKSATVISTTSTVNTAYPANFLPGTVDSTKYKIPFVLSGGSTSSASGGGASNTGGGVPCKSSAATYRGNWIFILLVVARVSIQKKNFV